MSTHLVPIFFSYSYSDKLSKPTTKIVVAVSCCCHYEQHPNEHKAVRLNDKSFNDKKELKKREKIENKNMLWGGGWKFPIKFIDWIVLENVQFNTNYWSGRMNIIDSQR